MASIASLFASLSLESTSFRRGVRDAANDADNANTRMTRAFSAMRAAGTAALVGLGGAMVGLGMTIRSQIQPAMDYTDAINDLSNQTGASRRFIQEFGYAASQSGSSVEAARAGIEKFTQILGQAQNGSRSAQTRLAELGVTSRDVDTAIRQAADGIQNLGTIAERRAATIDLFGRRNSDLVQVLAEGSEGLGLAARAAEELGIVLSDDVIRGADEANDKFATMKMIFDAQMADMIVRNADAIVTFADAILKVTGALISFFGAHPERALAIMGALAGASVGARAGPWGAAIGGAVGGIGGYVMGQGLRDPNQLLREERARIAGRLGGNSRFQSPTSRSETARLRARMAEIDQQLAGTGFIAQLGSTVMGIVNPTGGAGGAGALPTAPGRGSRGGGGGGRDPLEQARRMIEDLKFEQEQLTRTNRDQEIYNNLKRAGVPITHALGQEIARLTGELHDDEARQEYNEWLEDMVRDTENATRRIGLEGRALGREEFWQQIEERRRQMQIGGNGQQNEDGSEIVVTGRSLANLSAEERALYDANEARWDAEESHDAERRAREQANAQIQKSIGLLAAEEQRLRDSRLALANSMADIGFELFDSLIFGTKSWADALEDAIMDLGRLMLEELVYKPIREMIAQWAANFMMNAGGGKGGGGGFLGSLLSAFGVGGGGGSLSPKSLSGNVIGTGMKGMALGGPVGAGNSYWVGEKGPELFKPQTNGTIIPNHKFGGAAPIINVDARGATNPAEIEKAAQRAVIAAMPTITEASHAKTMNRLQRRRL